MLTCRAVNTETSFTSTPAQAGAWSLVKEVLTRVSVEEALDDSSDEEDSVYSQRETVVMLRR